MNVQRLLITERFFERYLPHIDSLAKAENFEYRYVPVSSGGVKTTAPSDGGPKLAADDLEWADSWLGFNLDFTPSESRIRWLHSASDGVTQFLPFSDDIQATGTLLTNTVGTMPERMAEYTVGAVVARVVGFPEYRTEQDAGIYHRRLNGTMLGRRITIAGTGNVGAEIARKFRPFLTRMSDAEPTEPLVRGLSLSGTPRPGFDAVTKLSSGEYLADADVLVLVLPQTPDTSSIIDDSVLQQLNGAIVVNVGRGGTLDSDALHRALDSGHVSHAILDVFEHEPLPADDWRWSHPSVTITPHTSGFTMISDVFEDFVANLHAIRDGVTPPRAVDLSRTY